MNAFLEKHGDFIGKAAIMAFFSSSAVMQISRLRFNWDAWQKTGTTVSFLTVLSNIAILGFLVLVVALTLVRHKPAGRARGLEPWLSAMAGTFLVLVIPFFPATFTPTAVTLVIGLIISTLGSILSVYVLSFLGRSFSIMAEARKLVTNGPYTLVRHPLYLAELVATFGAVILVSSLPGLLIMCVQWTLQMRRMTNEEGVLRKTFPDYATYAAATPKVIPTAQSLRAFLSA